MTQYHTLVLFSGGLDSTTCLFKLLSQTKDEVSTIYVDLDNNRHKSWCERLAVKILYDQAEKHFRELSSHTEAKASMTGGPGGESGGLAQPPIWMIHAAFKLSQTNTKLKKRVCVGYTRGDCAIAALPNIQSMWAGIWSMINSDPVPELYTPLVKSTKRNSQNFLKKIERDHKGLKILNTLWVCEDPDNVVTSKFVGYKPCGRCDPCKRAKKLK
jgi:7-cyano-7-deazaguanine synthase in queuosine biosynthesis